MVCSRVLIINEGKLVAADTMDALSKKIKKELKILFRFRSISDEVKNDIKKIRGVVDVEREVENSIVINADVEADPRQEILKYAIEKRIELIEMKEVIPTLEDIYLKLISQEVVAQ